MFTQLGALGCVTAFSVLFVFVRKLSDFCNISVKMNKYGEKKTEMCASINVNGETNQNCLSALGFFLQPC